jgi:hypothetical protein
VLLIAKIDECVEVSHAFEHEVAAAATAAAVRPTELDILFTAKTDAAIAAIATFYVYLGFI